MQIAESKQNAWTVLVLTGKVDQEGSAQLKAALAPHLTGGLVALDFTNVEYVTSVGFRVLLVALKEQTAKSGRLLLGNMSEPVRSFFDIAGLSTTFKVVHDIYPTVTAT
ncbi:MAG: STAS domain-containing protein [Verrucomicrobiota bacterium]